MLYEVITKADATINAAGPFCVTGGPVVITALQSGGTRNNFV